MVKAYYLSIFATRHDNTGDSSLSRRVNARSLVDARKAAQRVIDYHRQEYRDIKLRAIYPAFD